MVLYGKVFLSGIAETALIDAGWSKETRISTDEYTGSI